MANNINLPDLVSHLNVNLDGVSGAVADAARQGSAMGSALGNGVHRELDNLLRHLPQVQIDGDSDPLDRDLARVHRELAALDAQRIGIDISLPDAVRQLDQLHLQLQRIGDEHPRPEVRASTAQAAAQLDALLAAAHRVDDTDVSVDVHVDEDRLSRLPGMLSRIGRGLGTLGGFGATLGKVGAGIGAIVPAAAGVVTTLANIAPAAAVAVTGLAAVELASGTVKLATAGMGDAITAALDPSKTKDYAEALKALSPEARKFAESIHEAQPALHELQQDAQDKVFAGLSAQLERTGTSVLPVLRTNLLSTAGALNEMGKGVLAAGKDLGDSGVLGRALGSASKGLHNLANVPGIVATALGQIAAAAGPSFQRLTDGASNVAVEIGNKLGDAFKSGAMQTAIEQAISLIGQFAHVAGNFGQVIGNIFSAVPAGGGGLLQILGQISDALVEVTASPEVQGGLKAIFETMGQLGATVAPLLAQALSSIAPIFITLGPPVQTLITALGSGLSPIIIALGPVLQAAAETVGALVTALSPLLPVVGQLAASLLPAVTPLFEALTTAAVALAPVVAEVAGILTDTLAPILAQLPAIIQPLADVIATNLVVWIGILGDLIVQLGPSLVQLGGSFAQLMVAAMPLITILAAIATELLTHLTPAIAPLIQVAAAFASVLTGVLTTAITGVVMPALRAFASLLRGDVSGAANSMRSVISGVIGVVVGLFIAFPARVASAVSPLPGRLASAASSAGSQLTSILRSKVSEAVSLVGSLPGRARSALGSLGGALFSAGASLISGFISGITSRIGAVQSTLSNLTGKLSDWKGPKKKDAKILTPAGRLLIEGFIAGIDGTTAQLKAKLKSLTNALPANVKSGLGKQLKKATAQLQALVQQRDGVLKKLADGQKKLDALVKARDKAASDITSGILQDANITTGHADVNSVSAITIGLQQSLKATQAFEANIAKLKKEGLRSDLLQQIADDGVEAGGATASALANATPAELKQINDLQAQLSKSATSTGNTVGDALYGAGIQAAKGLVAGLQSQERAIESEMKKIANSMLNTVKKAHKTHSPSRAFHDIGVMDGEGLRGGFQSMAAKVRAAARNVAGAALDITAGAFPVTPSSAQLAAVYAGGGSGDQTNHFHLYGSDATPGGILRALSWQGLVGRS